MTEVGFEGKIKDYITTFKTTLKTKVFKENKYKNLSLALLDFGFLQTCLNISCLTSFPNLFPNFLSKKFTFSKFYS